MRSAKEESVTGSGGLQSQELRCPEGGWEEFDSETEAVAERVEEVVEDKNNSFEECMEKNNMIENKVKYKSFGKTRKTMAKVKPKKVQKCVQWGWLEQARG